MFPDVVELLDLRFQHSWRAIFATDPPEMPRLAFGSWVGGDRDGHPFVTPEVTAKTLGMLRESALSVLRGRLKKIGARLSLAESVQPAPAGLKKRIQDVASLLGEASRGALDRNPGEPWRQMVNLMQLRLERSGSIVRGCSTEGGGYTPRAELLEDVAVLERSLHEAGAHRIAEIDVRPLAAQVRVLGFHSAILDIRQNSAYHDRAIAGLLRAAGFAKHDYPKWSEAEKLEFLNRELNTPRPFTGAHMHLEGEAEQVVSLFRMLREHLVQFGPHGIGPLIVSMTRSTADLLGVYLLAREGGLLVGEPGALASELPVVPLFETIRDLERCEPITDAFLAHPVTQADVGSSAAQGRGIYERPAGDARLQRQ